MSHIACAAAAWLILPHCWGGDTITTGAPLQPTQASTQPASTFPPNPTPPLAPTPAGAHMLNFTNSCKEPVWVGALANNANFVLPNQGGWLLAPGQTMGVIITGLWSGRFWGRTGCATTDGTFKCDTGDCGGLTCDGRGAQPVSLIEMTLSGADGLDTYDISLVDAFNLTLSIAPNPGTYTATDVANQSCQAATCSQDINAICPTAEQMHNAAGTVVGCLSACSATNTDAACCRGAYNIPKTCPPTPVANLFKKACPEAYSYAYDDSSSTYTCAASGYTITFCPADAASL